MSAPFETEEEDIALAEDEHKAPVTFKCPHCKRKKEPYETRGGVRLCYTCFNRPYPLPPGCYWRDDDVNSFETVSIAVEAQEKEAKRMIKAKNDMVKNLSRGALTGWQPEESDSDDENPGSDSESESSSSESESEESDSDSDDESKAASKTIIGKKGVKTLADVLAASKENAPGTKKRKASTTDASATTAADVSVNGGEEAKKEKIRRGLYKNRRIMCFNQHTLESFTVTGTKNVMKQIPSMTRNKMTNCLFNPFYRTREGWQLVDLSEGFSKRKFNEEMVDEINFTKLASSNDFKINPKPGAVSKPPSVRPIPKYRRLPPVWGKRPGDPERYFKNRKVATEELQLPKWAVTNFLSNKQRSIPGGWTFSYVPTEANTIKANAARIAKEAATAASVVSLKAQAKSAADTAVAKAATALKAATEAAILSAKTSERARNRSAPYSTDFPYVAYHVSDESKVLAGDNKHVLCFESQSEAAEAFECVQPFISLILNGRRKTVKGHKLMLRETLEEKRREVRTKRQKTSE